jgi:hypothetical protein
MTEAAMTEWNEERASITGSDVDANIPRQADPISPRERGILLGILLGGPAIVIVVVWLAR